MEVWKFVVTKNSIRLVNVGNSVKCMTLYGLIGSDYGTIEYQIWYCLCDQEWSDCARQRAIVIGVFTDGAQWHFLYEN